MRNVSDKSCRDEKQVLHSIIFSPGTRDFYEILWKNMVEPDRSQMTIYGKARQVTDDNIIRGRKDAFCTPGDLRQGHRNALIIFHSYTLLRAMRNIL
jgi:hypothetical protein